MKQKDINMADGDVNSVDSQRAEERLEDDLNPQDPPDDSELANIIEAALYAANEPLGIRKLASLFSEDAQPSKVDIQNVILVLQEQCEHRGIELRRIGIGWRYQTKEKYAPWLRKLSGQKSPRYSRALLETLSIIAYRQPVTRGDIEEVRGVGVSSDTIRTLEERGWIAQIGHRDVPGRPSLFGTTQVFLEYFNMASLSELPELMEKRELRTIAQEMNLTLPMDGVQNETNTSEAQLTDAEAESEQAGSANVVELHPSHDTNENDSGVASSEGIEPKPDASNGNKITTSDESDDPEGVS